MTKKILGIIPARGGSKGVTRKNIRRVGGKPLIYWSIIAAKESNFLTRNYVTTDDSEIAEIAKSLLGIYFWRKSRGNRDLAEYMVEKVVFPLQVS